MLRPGESAVITKVITEQEIYSFAEITGDFNPVHMDEETAEKSLFKKRVVHGMLVGGLISAVIGTKMPGEGSIYLEQNLKFVAPVYIGDRCTAKVTVAEVLNAEKGIYRLNTQVRNQDNIKVIDGDAIVKNEAWGING